MLDEYLEDQPIAYKIIKNIVLKDRLSHAYLIEANSYSEKNELARAFAKYLLCEKHHTTMPKETCPICNQLDIQNLLDIKIIKPDGMWIKKSQMEDLQQEFEKKSFIGNKKIYIIEEADRLNISSSNSVLKFLEEPEEGIIAILIVDNLYQVPPTIISRCQIINLRKNKFRKNDIMASQKRKKYFHLKFESSLDEEKFEMEIKQVIQFALYYEKNKLGTLLHVQKNWFQYFSSKDSIQIALEVFLCVYKDVLNILCGRSLEMFTDYQDQLMELAKNNTISIICDKINVITESKESIKLNLNLNLLMDNLICKLKEVEKWKK